MDTERICQGLAFRKVDMLNRRGGLVTKNYYRRGGLVSHNGYRKNMSRLGFQEGRYAQ